MNIYLKKIRNRIQQHWPKRTFRERCNLNRPYGFFNSEPKGTFREKCNLNNLQKSKLIAFGCITTTIINPNLAVYEFFLFIPSILFLIDNFKFKLSFLESEKIKPDHYFLIPKYLKLLEKKNKASSGFDAISQAIESIFSLKSSKGSRLISITLFHDSSKVLMHSRI